MRKHAGYISSEVPYDELPKVPAGSAPGVSNIAYKINTGELIEWGVLNSTTRIVSSYPDEWAARQLMAVDHSGKYFIVYRLFKGASVSAWMLA